MSDVTGGGDDWLVEPAHPQLQGNALVERLNDDRRPDRLAWNTFRTLAEWDTDVWVPAMLEVACGVPNPLSGREWSGAEVVMWGSGLQLDDTADLLIDGPEALVIVEASFRNDVPASHAIAGIRRGLELARHQKQAGYVFVSPDRPPALAQATASLASELADMDGVDFDALGRAVGWSSWRDLGRLALDLAEEADDIRDELVHRLVTELQALFPGIEI
jgi:hypothetical protein